MSTGCERRVGEVVARKRVESGARRCGTCGMTGHNARTCENDMEMSGESSDE